MNNAHMLLSKAKNKDRLKISEDENTLIFDGTDYKTAPAVSLCKGCDFFTCDFHKTECALYELYLPTFCVPSNRKDKKVIIWKKVSTEQSTDTAN